MLHCFKAVKAEEKCLSKRRPDLSNFSVFAQLRPASDCSLCLDAGASSQRAGRILLRRFRLGASSELNLSSATSRLLAKSPQKFPKIATFSIEIFFNISYIATSGNTGRNWLDAGACFTETFGASSKLYCDMPAGFY